jgi:ribonuclease I
MSEAGDRYVVITPDNQSANIWVSALISVGVASSCVGVRIISRAKIGFKFGIDDYVFAVAWVGHYCSMDEILS